MKIFGIVGAGGFGREVMPVARNYLLSLYGPGGFDLVFIDNKMAGKLINGYKVLNESDFFSQNAEKYFNIAIADSHVREEIAKVFHEKNIAPFTITANNSVILDENQICEGAILCPFTTITSNAKIGKFFHANIYSYVAHDCEIGDFVTFAPNVQCNGGVIIEDHAYIGTGVIIKQSTIDKPIVIGRGAIVGMGAVVTKSVLPLTTVIGNPAVPLIKKTFIESPG